jgi:hypothetical protein
VQFTEVDISAKQGSGPAMSVDGVVSYQKPRNFRMKAVSLGMGTVADLGSNDREFWFRFKQDASQALYHCSYEALPQLQNLRLPVHPDWIAEAMCVQELGDPQRYQVRYTDRYADLYTQTTSLQGQQLTKIITVYLTGPHQGRIAAIWLRTPQGQDIWSAEISDYQAAQNGIVVPKRIKLRSVADKSQIELRLAGTKINEQIQGSEFARPNHPVEIDLARGPQGTPTGVQRVRGNLEQ